MGVNWASSGENLSSEFATWLDAQTVRTFVNLASCP